MNLKTKSLHFSALSHDIISIQSQKIFIQSLSKNKNYDHLILFNDRVVIYFQFRFRKTKFIYVHNTHNRKYAVVIPGIQIFRQFAMKNNRRRGSHKLRFPSRLNYCQWNYVLYLSLMPR